MKLNKNKIIPALRKYKIVIILTICLLIYLLVIMPLFKKWNDTNRRISYFENRLVKDLPHLKDEVKINSLYETLISMMNIITENKHPEELKTEIYDMLNKAARRYNVAIKRYRPTIREIRGITSSSRRRSSRSQRSSRYSNLETDKDTANNEPQYSIIINLELESMLLDFVYFVYYIENSSYLMQVKEANFAPLKGGRMRISITIKKIVL